MVKINVDIKINLSLSLVLAVHAALEVARWMPDVLQLLQQMTN